MCIPIDISLILNIFRVKILLGSDPYISVSITSAKDRVRISSVVDQVVVEADITPQPPAPPPVLSSPKIKKANPVDAAVSTDQAGTGTAAAGKDKGKDAVTANGPTRIPLSQRRQPPPKLNLTLDLSVPPSWPSSAKKIQSSVESIPQEKGDSKGGGIEASSGVVSMDTRTVFLTSYSGTSVITTCRTPSICFN